MPASVAFRVFYLWVIGMKSSRGCPAAALATWDISAFFHIRALASRQLSAS